MIAKPSRQRSCEHVGDEKGEGQAADAFIVDLKCSLYQWLHAGQDIAVGIVQQVQRGQQSQSGPRRGRWQSRR